MKVLIKNRHLVLFWLMLLCALAASAQSRRSQTKEGAPPPPKPSGLHVDVNGRFDGATYTNDGLGFSVTLPDGWQAQDIAVQQKLADAVNEKTDKITGNQAAIQASVARTSTLFIAVKPTDGKVNPIVVAMDEDIALIFSVRTPRQYIESMRQAVPETSPIAFDQQSTTEQIGGVEFAVLGAGPKEPNTSKSSNLRQSYYVTLRRNHALAFILTYDGAEQQQACREILNSLRFQ